MLVYAFFKGKNWIRTPGLIYVGAMLHGYTEFLYYELVLGPSPTNLPVFWAFNAPYGIVPLLLGIRLWRAPVFAAEDAAAPEHPAYPGAEPVNR